jgi:adhesin transport system outer membrane protein
MAKRLKPAGTVRATPDLWRGLMWLALGFAALLAAAPAPVVAAAPSPALAAAPAPTQLALPPPLADPRAIDFAADPVLRFVGTATGGDDFASTIVAAVLRHPRRAEAEAGIAVADAGRREVRAGLFPVLSASVLGSRSLARDFADSSAAVERLLPRGRADASLGADQLLFDFGATGARIAGASARRRAAAADADASAAVFALDAVTAWYQVIGFQALADLSEAMVARHHAILADTEARVAAGIGAGGDTARAQAGLADAIGDAARTQRSLAAVRAQFRERFGAEAPLRPLRPALPAIASASADAATLASHAVPQVAAAEANVAAAAAEARAVRSDALPRLSAGVAATRFNLGGPGPNYDVRGQFALRQSLSVGGAEAARNAAADARRRAATAAAETARLEAERDAAAAFAESRLLDTSVVALIDAYRANRRNRDITAEQFRQSRGSLIDLLRTESDYFAAARALLLGNIERDLSRYALLARTGGLLGHFAIPSER